MATNPLTATSVGLDPAPCGPDQAQANWGRVSQIPMQLQDQITGPGGLSTLVTNLNLLNTDQITNFITNLLNTIIKNNICNTVVNNFYNYTVQQLPGYNGGLNQIIWNNNGTITWVTATLYSPVSAWQYATSGHKFQTKTQPMYVISGGSETAYANTSGGQPVTQTAPSTAFEYNTGTHQFRKKVLNSVYVLEDGTESAYSSWYSTVLMDNIVTEVDYSSHELYDKYTPSVYVLEAGTPNTHNSIFTAVAKDIVTAAVYSSHKLTITKSSTAYVLEGGSSADTDVLTAVSKDIVTDVFWSSPDLKETKSSTAYVLEGGSSATTTIDTATACT